MVGKILAEEDIDNVDAIGLISLIYHDGGYGVDKDLEKFEFWIKKAADKGDIDSAYWLAVYYLEKYTSYENIEDLNKSIHYLELVAEKKENCSEENKEKKIHSCEILSEIYSTEEYMDEKKHVLYLDKLNFLRDN